WRAELLSPDEEHRDGAGEGAKGEPPTDEFFEGIPPELLDSDEETPAELEPEFQEALRDAAPPPPDPAAGQGPDTVEYDVAAEEDEVEEDGGEEEHERSDGTAGEQPQEVAPKPVRHVVI